MDSGLWAVICAVGLSACSPAPDCSESDYYTTYGLCVFDHTNKLTPQETEAFLDQYFTSFQARSGIEAPKDSLRSFYLKHNVSLSVVSMNDWVDDSVGADTQKSGQDIWIELRADKRLNDRTTVHELLHTLQDYMGGDMLVDKHSKPAGWFWQVNEAGQMLPDITSLEYWITTDVAGW